MPVYQPTYVKKSNQEHARSNLLCDFLHVACYVSSEEDIHIFSPFSWNLCDDGFCLFVENLDEASFSSSRSLVQLKPHINESIADLVGELQPLQFGSSVDELGQGNARIFRREVVRHEQFYVLYGRDTTRL